MNISRFNLSLFNSTSSPIANVAGLRALGWRRIAGAGQITFQASFDGINWGNVLQIDTSTVSFLTTQQFTGSYPLDALPPYWRITASTPATVWVELLTGDTPTSDVSLASLELNNSTVSNPVRLDNEVIPNFYIYLGGDNSSTLSLQASENKDYWYTVQTINLASETPYVPKVILPVTELVSQPPYWRITAPSAATARLALVISSVQKQTSSGNGTCPLEMVFSNEAGGLESSPNIRTDRNSLLFGTSQRFGISSSVFNGTPSLLVRDATANLDIAGVNSSGIATIGRFTGTELSLTGKAYLNGVTNFSLRSDIFSGAQSIVFRNETTSTDIAGIATDGTFRAAKYTTLGTSPFSISSSVYNSTPSLVIRDETSNTVIGGINSSFLSSVGRIEGSTLRAAGTYTRAALPPPGNAGTLARITDSTRGFLYDNGAQWVDLQGEAFSVRAFGAKGDGTTDDTAALTAAVNAASAAQGHVRIPAGSYLLSNVLTVPSNVTLVFDPGAKITKVAASAGAITFQGAGVVANVRQIIFSGFSPGQVQWTGVYPHRISVVWFGAVGDNVTDDLPAFRSAVEGLNNNTYMYHAYRGAWIEVPVPPLQYYLSDTWHITRPVTINGSDKAFIDGARIRPNPLKTAIYVHVYSSATTLGYPTDTNAGTTRIKGLQILYGGRKPDDTTFNLSGLTLTRTGGASLAKVDKFYGVRVNGWVYIIESKSGNTMTLLRPRFFAQITVGTNVLIDPTGLVPFPVTGGVGDWTGSTVVLDGGRYTFTIVSHTANQIVLNANFTGTPTSGATWSGEVRLINGIASNLTGLNGTALDAHGIDVKAQSFIEDCYIYGANGNAINIDTGLDPYQSGATFNANNFGVTGNAIYFAAAHGILTRGPDSNNGRIEANDFTDNYGYGACNGSFLGNLLLSNHAAFNIQGAYVNPAAEAANGANDNAHHVLVGNYAEGAQPPDVLGQGDLKIAGTDGAGTARWSKGADLQAAGNTLLNRRAYLVRNTKIGANSVVFQLGDTSEDTGVSGEAQLFAFGSAHEPLNSFYAGSEDNPYPLYRFKYWSNFGYYGFYYNNATVNPAFALSGGAAAEGGGNAWCANSLFFGGGRDVRVKHNGTALAFRNNNDTSFAAIAAGLGTFTQVSSGDVASTGDISLSTAGKRLKLKSGTNASIGTVVLAAGVATVTNTSVTTSSRIFVQRQSDSGTVGASYSISINPGVSFTITAKDGTGATQTADTSTVAWWIVESI